MITKFIIWYLIGMIGYLVITKIENSKITIRDIVLSLTLWGILGISSIIINVLFISTDNNEGLNKKLF